MNTQQKLIKEIFWNYSESQIEKKIIPALQKELKDREEWGIYERKSKNNKVRTR